MLRGDRGHSIFLRGIYTAVGRFAALPDSVQRREAAQATRDEIYDLRAREVEAAKRAAQAAGIDPRDSPEYLAALDALRAHSRSSTAETTAAALGGNTKMYIGLLLFVLACIALGLLFVFAIVLGTAGTWAAPAALTGGYLAHWLWPTRPHAYMPRVRDYLHELVVPDMRRTALFAVGAWTLGLPALLLAIEGALPGGWLIVWVLNGVAAGAVLQLVRAHRARAVATGRAAGTPRREG